MERNLIITGIIVVAVSLIIFAVYMLEKKLKEKASNKKAEHITLAKKAGNYFELSGFVVAKGKKTAKEAGFGENVIEQLPKILRSQKLPIIKVKINGKFQNLVCDESVFEKVELYKEHKLKLAGSVVTDVKVLRK